MGVSPLETVALVQLLTTREREVAQLIARGYSNRRIAEELVIAPSTAERHVANILTKVEPAIQN